jgi:hypothetical protein
MEDCLTQQQADEWFKKRAHVYCAHLHARITERDCKALQTKARKALRGEANVSKKGRTPEFWLEGPADMNHELVACSGCRRSDVKWKASQKLKALLSRTSDKCLDPEPEGEWHGGFI